MQILTSEHIVVHKQQTKSYIQAHNSAQTIIKNLTSEHKGSFMLVRAQQSRLGVRVAGVDPFHQNFFGVLQKNLTNYW
jgi:hypothetical protein